MKANDLLWCGGLKSRWDDWFIVGGGFTIRICLFSCLPDKDQAVQYHTAIPTSVLQDQHFVRHKGWERASKMKT